MNSYQRVLSAFKRVKKSLNVEHDGKVQIHRQILLCLWPRVDRQDPPKLITPNIKLAYSEYFKESFEKNRHTLKSKQYNDTQTSSKRPVLRPAEVDPPKPPSPSMASTLTEESGTSAAEAANIQDLNDLDYMDDAMQPIEVEEYKLTQSDMDFLVAYLNLSQRNSEFLVGFFKKKKVDCGWS